MAIRLNLFFSVDITQAGAAGFVFLNGHKSEFKNTFPFGKNFFVIFSKDKDNCSYICFIRENVIRITINPNHIQSIINAEAIFSNRADDKGDIVVRLCDIHSLEDIISHICNFKNENSFKVFEKYCFHINHIKQNNFKNIYDGISSNITYKIRSKINDIYCDEYIFNKGKIIVYFTGGIKYTNFMIHINYDDNWYVIKRYDSNSDFKMYSFSNRDNSLNPFQFQFGDEIKSFNVKDIDLLFEEESFNNIMKKIDLECIFKN